ncbi:MCE family protein, partial [Mycolicibacterium conceptionense]
FEDKTQLTVLSGRAGLSMDPGSKVTFNGVPIGRLASIDVVTVGDNPEAKLTLDVKPQYLKLIPENVTAELRATTVFGNKYISFLSPPNPSPQRLTPDTPIRAQGVTTEFNTLFETITAISEQIDPIKLNQTLTATAQALDGLGDKFGQSIVNGNDILADLNPRMPQIRRDISGLADLGEVYANAGPDLFDGLTNAVTTARSLNEQRGNLDQALVAAVGFGNTGGDIFER